MKLNKSGIWYSCRNAGLCLLFSAINVIIYKKSLKIITNEILG